jgi:hypothetical protein
MHLKAKQSQTRQQPLRYLETSNEKYTLTYLVQSQVSLEVRSTNTITRENRSVPESMIGMMLTDF